MKKNKKPRVDKKSYCPEAYKSKLRFPTRKAARDFIERNAAEIEEETGYAPDHEYFCRACNCYHVTSHKKKQKEGEIGYSIDPYLTIVFRKLTKAMLNLVGGKTHEALIKIQEAIPIMFWELRLTKYKVEKKYLQKIMKEFVKEIGIEVKSLKKNRMEDSRLIYYETKLTEIEEEGGDTLHSVLRADTGHLTPILGRRKILGEEQFSACLECFQLIRKISSMSLIGSRPKNIKDAWDELERGIEKVSDPEAYSLLEKMRDLLY